ncbi:hypothetical protein CgunFtcFv8_027440 [Champsocephalus gunnari]|uniref:Uncharacterized protein n=1 Tax=Champsocephalus gunnari TaxID=52237 RepID=A0AAN8E2F0_CHAGU|nr:hypothetical protein CgunFtcFv8_027440 [Champsocephalus gunnari]
MAEKRSPQTHSHSVTNLFLSRYQATLIAFDFGCECVCAQDEFRCVSLYRRPGNLSAPRSNEPRNVPTNQSTLGSQQELQQAV